MRDSRIGAYGAMALGLSLLIRWSALSQLVDPTQALFALVGAHAASRGVLGAFMHLLPPARDDGLSAGAGTVSLEIAVVGAVLGAIPLLLLGLGGAIAALILLGLLFAAFHALCLNQIGGQTGDTIGALQQVSEIAVLLVASVALPDPFGDSCAPCLQIADELRAACIDPSTGSVRRQCGRPPPVALTKPQGSLSRLETIAAWLRAGRAATCRGSTA